MGYHEPLLKAELDDLRPTQITVGHAEVVIKRAQWAAMKTKERERQLAAHCFPAVKGPKGRFYIVDHHHLGLALREEGLDTVWVMQLADLSEVEGEVFWRMMEFHRWAHPFDHKGKRRGYEAIPESIDGLRDDPYRSLAGCVRNAGGYAKDTQPYAEFLDRRRGQRPAAVARRPHRSRGDRVHPSVARGVSRQRARRCTSLRR